MDTFVAAGIRVALRFSKTRLSLLSQHRWRNAVLLFEFWIKRIMFPSRKEVRGKYKKVYVADIAFVGSFGVCYLAFLILGGRTALFRPDAGIMDSDFSYRLPFGIF